jgi:hypothetical protein
MDSTTTTAGNAQLMQAIQTLLEANEDSISIPMTALNQGIAQLSQQNSKATVKLGNAIIKEIAQGVADNNAAVDQIGTAVLEPLFDWQAQNDLLLNQLASASGLIQPGDPLIAALTQQASDQPELAYSATLLLALRDAIALVPPFLEVLREIRDRMPSLPVTFTGESRQTGTVIQEPDDFLKSIEENW